MEYTYHYASPLGAITLASDGESLTGLWFDGQKYFAATLSPDHREAALPVFDEAKHWLDTYFAGRAPAFTPKLAPKGTAFRRAVWQVLLTIPRGETRTYGEVGRAVAGQLDLSRMSAQAVGGAVGRNPISLLIPCHRVVGADGSLTGYAGGVEKKLRLLSLEGADLSALSLPRRGTAL
ncbi:MAG: methylated-DNA--[Oscillibacter sp.]|nr:methylated-DNA--[protein]-cysteine S-methyltransferase [Oscillibacter sp.]